MRGLCDRQRARLRGPFAYVNTSPLLFIEGYGVSRAGFAGLFAITASGAIVGSSLNNGLLRLHARPKAVLDAALALATLAGLVLLAIGVAGVGFALIVALPVLLYISLFGLVFPNASHERCIRCRRCAGVASAVLVTVQMLFGALGGATAAGLYRNASPLSIGLVMSIGALGAAALYAFWLRQSIDE